jgi:hypothetical protein
MRLVAFCEAAADFEIASALLDRVLRHEGPAWLADLLDTAPENIRSWQGDGQGREFFVVGKIRTYVDELGVRVPHGHFDGRPGAVEAVMGRTVFSIARALARRGDDVDAVLVIRDMDDRPDRKTGLGEARAEAQAWASFRIILGCADPKREAWVMCGFEPETDEERVLLGDLRSALGFQPHLEAHRLVAKDEQAKKSAKRVLRLLTGKDRERERRCWTDTSLDVLRERGGTTGLRDYLVDVERDLVPLLRSP